LTSLRLLRRGIGILIVLCAVALYVSKPVHAQTTIQPISIICTGTGQACTPSYSTVVNVLQAGTMILNYTAPQNQCAAWRVHFYIDGVVQGVSGVLQSPALSSGPISIANLSAGNHTVALQAEGVLGGCDTGTLIAWSGTLTIQLPSAQTGPPPFLTSLVPSSTPPGGPGFSLTVNGSAFLPGAGVQWNGLSLITSFLSSTQLSAAVPAALITNPGSANITVVNAVGAPTSNPVAFLIGQPLTPLITGVVNAYSFGPQICPGAMAFVNGSGLGANPILPPPAPSGITVTVGGKPGFVVGGSASQLLLQIPFEATPGASTITVAFNGTTSAPFNIALSKFCPSLQTVNSGGTGTVNSFDLTTPPGPGPMLPSIKPGDTLTLYATGLGATNPPTATGQTGVMNPTATPVSISIGGTAVPAGNILYAGTASGPPGLYLVNVKLPGNFQGTQSIVLTVGDASSQNGVTLPLAGIDSVVSNASFGSAGTAAPGSIVTVFANGLGQTDQITGFPASSFQGVQVAFNGTAAPLFHLVTSVSPQQIDLLVPQELPTSGTVNVQLSTPNGVNPNYVLNMAPAVPGLYRIIDPSNKTRSNVIAQFANTAWLALPASTTAALKLPACTPAQNPLSVCGGPADIGDYLVIYATGLGLTTPNGNSNAKPLATGAIPPADGSVLYETPVKPVVTLGGVPATVLYSGLAPGFPGEYQVDVQVPGGVANGDDIPLVITMAGLSDSATISIQPRYGLPAR